MDNPHYILYDGCYQLYESRLKMQRDLFDIITELQTPYKLNKPVLSASGVQGAFDSMAVDCPFIFYHQNQFHMLYVGFDGLGYQTALAVSNDLLHWQLKGLVLPRDAHVGWDRAGAAGTWILKESNNLVDIPVLKKVDGRYWMLYHSYPGQGYEVGAAEMGLAWTEDESLLDWHRLDKPVFSWRDGEDWEKGGLYKGCLIEHQEKFYLFYNAKCVPQSDRWTEQTGAAFSDDMLHWHRNATNPVLRVKANTWNSVFCSDPCVTRFHDQWLMFFFGFDGKHAQDGVAVSDDLVTWEKYPEPILGFGCAGSLDATHAHKPSVIFHDGTLYHFYCAVRSHQDGDPARSLGDEFRCITVAASKPLNTGE
jgi:predicted GH43/DUF377 family glycosyl hydrolase